jgi:hypothetical protein
MHGGKRKSSCHTGTSMIEIDLALTVLILRIVQANWLKESIDIDLIYG